MAIKSYSLQKATNPVIRYFLFEVGKSYDSNRGLSHFGSKAHQNDVLKFFNYRCCYCLNKLIDKVIDFDHLIPLNKTSCGLHSWGNLAPACKSCNNLKDALEWNIFMDELFNYSNQMVHKLNPKKTKNLKKKKYFSNNYSFESRKGKIELFTRKYNYSPDVTHIKIKAEELYNEMKAITNALVIERIKQTNK